MTLISRSREIGCTLQAKSSEQPLRGHSGGSSASFSRSKTAKPPRCAFPRCLETRHSVLFPANPTPVRQNAVLKERKGAACRKSAVNSGPKAQKGPERPSGRPFAPSCPGFLFGDNGDNLSSNAQISHVQHLISYRPQQASQAFLRQTAGTMCAPKTVTS